MTPLLTKQEVAALLRVSPRTITNLCKKRLLPFHLVESRKRFTDEDIADYLARRSFGHRSDLSSPAGT